MQRFRGDEAKLLREVIGRVEVVLTRYGLKLTHTVDVEDNSYTVDVLPDGLDHVGVLMRLERYEDFQSLLHEIVFTEDEAARKIAMQRAGCMLDPRALRLVEGTE
jgi:hypothetical protein